MTRRRMDLLVAPLLLIGVLLAVLALAPGTAQAKSVGFYQQTNLVSDLPGEAQVTDPNLVNAWGLSHSATSPWWISDNGTGFSTLYQGTGAIVPLVVTIPPPAGSPAGTTAAPTGNIFNGSTDFVVSENGVSGASAFIFDTEDGTISGWNPTVDRAHAVLTVDNSAKKAVYKGLAIASNSAGNFLYATNFHSGFVEVYDAHFHLVRVFTDIFLAKDCPLPGQCYAPFGIQTLNGNLFVSYALQNAAKHDDVAGRGHGFVDVFDTWGHFVRRFASRGVLNSPWGLAQAPASFGRFSNDILVGNFGDGTINAFSPKDGEFLGRVRDSKGHAITINGLWGLAFGNDASAGSSTTLFFTAGLNDEADGLFGTITSVSS